MQNLGIFPEAFDFSTVLNRYFLTCHNEWGNHYTMGVVSHRRKSNVPELIFKDGNLKCQVQRKAVTETDKAYTFLKVT